MKRLGIVSLLLAALLGTVAAAAPKISVDSPVYATTVPAGTVAHHTFQLTNTGNATLKITNVEVACGCTTVSLSKQELAPGESVGLVATVDTAGFTGVVQKPIEVVSNDPATPRLVLTFSLVLVTKQAYHIEVIQLYQAFYILIDLRTAAEYSSGHLTGALNIPYVELNTWTSRLPKESPLILYDQTGALSDPAAQTLRGLGFSQAQSLFGGLSEWTRLYAKRFISPL